MNTWAKDQLDWVIGQRWIRGSAPSPLGLTPEVYGQKKCNIGQAVTKAFAVSILDWFIASGENT